MSEPATLGALIRERRLAQGLSLGQLATSVGRTAATVRAWERGQHLPATDVVERLAASLGIDGAEIEAFMYREPPSLTVVSVEPATGEVASESTSVSGEASVETAEAVGDDDTPESGEVESAPAAAAAAEASFVAASADELGVMPRIEASRPADVVEAAGADDLDQHEVSPDDEDHGRADAVGAEAQGPDEGASAADDDGDIADEVTDGIVDDTAAGSTDVTEDLESEIEMHGDDAIPAPAAPAEDDAAALVDEPTEAIGPPIAAQPAEAGHVGVAVRAETLTEPDLPAFLAPLRSIFDPQKKWLYWIRASLTVVALLIMLVVLGWAAGELFDGLGEVLDTIESTDSIDSDLLPTS